MTPRLDSDASIQRHLAVALDGIGDGPIAVGLSGGCDSMVLLHALAAQPAARDRGLRAIHVDHGLNPHSADWAAKAQSAAAALDVPCLVLRVDVARNQGTGPEAAARAARYAAWAEHLAAGEILALAHHRDDQVETLLLKLLRGAGAEGLGAMRPWRALAAGWLWRPFLDLPRTALADYAQAAGLTWVDDPSNTDQRMDRNYLRHRVLPLLRERWPRSDAVIARSAEWQRANADYLAEQVEAAAARLQGPDPASLYIEPWLALPPALRDPVLRHWLRQLNLAQPTHPQALEAIRQLGAAVAESNPLLRWPGTELRRYRDLLHAMPTLSVIPEGWQADFDGSPVQLPGELGTLQLHGEFDRAAMAGWSVRFRRGGERIQLAGESMHRELRDLFQQRSVAPWLRGRLPIIVDARNDVVAVADLCSSTLAAAAWTASSHLVWTR